MSLPTILLRPSYKTILSAAVASGVLLASAGIAQAQAAGGENPPYVMADSSRTADYEEALQSWRGDPQFAVDYTKGYLGLRPNEPQVLVLGEIQT